MDTQNPAKQPLKRRRCPNCNKVFQPTRKWARFHSDKCRKEFHRYGAGYAPIKAGLMKSIEEKYAALKKEVVSEIRAKARQMELLIVEVAGLRAKVDLLRGQYEKHTHAVYESSTMGGECVTMQTGQPN